MYYKYAEYVLQICLMDLKALNGLSLSVDDKPIYGRKDLIPGRRPEGMKRRELHLRINLRVDHCQTEFQLSFYMGRNYIRWKL